jgi:hypothetical protein
MPGYSIFSLIGTSGGPFGRPTAGQNACLPSWTPYGFPAGGQPGLDTNFGSAKRHFGQIADDAARV